MPSPFLAPEATLYLETRRREGRLHEVDEIKRLPKPPAGTQQPAEWRRRAWSLRKVSRYVQSRPKDSQARARILDLGCGNGWMTAQLQSLTGSSLVGLDIHPYELACAARAFRGQTNLHFVCADIFSSVLTEASFDFVLLASSAQYFPDLDDLLERLFSLLKPAGEIILFDSPVYSPDAIPAARERSRRHYESIGVPEMASHYFHLDSSQIEHHDPLYLYQPQSLRHRLLRRALRWPSSPFPILSFRCPASAVETA